MDNNIYNEPELILRVSLSDQQAFSELISRYTRIIYPHLLSYIKDAQRAEEITQDIFMRIWNQKEKLLAIDNFPGYVHIITKNRALSALKEKLLSTDNSQIDSLESVVSQEEASLELKELASIINKAIESLPPRRKEVFTLSRKENLTYEEIASKLEISRSAVRQHIVEALVYLRMYLKDHMH